MYIVDIVQLNWSIRLLAFPFIVLMSLCNEAINYRRAWGVYRLWKKHGQLAHLNIMQFQGQEIIQGSKIFTYNIFSTVPVQVLVICYTNPFCIVHTGTDGLIRASGEFIEFPDCCASGSVTFTFPGLEGCASCCK